jgi:hypothetical protein
MRIANVIAGALAANRVAFGLGYLIDPRRTGRGWVGPRAEERPATVLTRALGARDFALGAGALLAMREDPRRARPWFAAHAVADASDLAATVAARDGLPRQGYLFAVAMAGASTVAAIVGATAAD